MITGVSGGADSVCLLLVLQKLAAELSISIEAVHINHGIRTEAAGDAEFVRRLCEDRGIPFHLICADVETQAKQEKMSTEEMGRKIRYEAFRQILGERKGRIAVAHTRCCVICSGELDLRERAVSVRYRVKSSVPCFFLSGRKSNSGYRNRGFLSVRMQRIWGMTIPGTGSGIIFCLMQRRKLCTEPRPI